ncbi:MAG: ATP-grasp domain-containing protein [Patescibacteria group bacterium]|nr:ATP-grasp domain-containing protein [Patescibacteria group bacterium]
MGNSVLFFEKYPFMGVELFGLLGNNYRLLSYYDDDCYKMLKKSGYPVITYGNVNFLETIDSDKAVGFILSDNQYLKKTIKEDGNDDKALFFYMSEEMDKLCKRQKIKMVLPSYTVQERMGNKLFLQDICKKLGIEVNKSISINKVDEDVSKIYTKCLDELETPFIVQGGLGVSGEDTFIINSEQELTNYLPKLSNKFRASKFLKKNIPLSVHICITKDKTYYEGPYIQLVGFRELAKNPFQFTGNDTNQKIITEDIKKIIFELSKKLSKYAESEGYLGILGIDFLWNLETEKVYVQEINSRLVGLTRLLTGIQKEQKIIPDLVRHINEFTKLKINKNYQSKKISLSKNNYSQIYISHNSDNEVLVKKYLLPGIYKITGNGLVRTKNSLFVSDMNPDEILVNFSIYGGTKLHADQVMFKIILKSSVLSENKYELNENLVKIIKTLKSEIL